jgi:hypothetical protein
MELVTHERDRGELSIGDLPAFLVEVEVFVGAYG